MNNFLLLFVCTGNICRSPMAEGIMKDMVIDEIDSKHQVMPLEVLSAGTHAPQGRYASSHAITVAGRHDINLKYHRSRHITPQIAQASDLILTMEQAQADEIGEMWSDISYVYPLKTFGRGENETLETLDITDPIGMDEDVYSRIFDEISGELKRIKNLVFSLALDKYRAK